MGMMETRRKVMAYHPVSGGLPAEYTQIEYLEGTGTQYIATDYVAPAGCAVEIEFAITASYSGDKMIMGARDTNLATCYAELYSATRWYSSNGEMKYSNVMGIASSQAQNLVGSKHKFTMNSTNVSVDYLGGLSAIPNGTVNAPNNSIHLFAWNGSPQYIHDCLRIYGLKFFNNGSLSANFIPCIRNSDNEPGMYDTIAGKFYSNAGTGTFVIPT